MPHGIFDIPTQKQQGSREKEKRNMVRKKDKGPSSLPISPADVQGKYED